MIAPHLKIKILMHYDSTRFVPTISIKKILRHQTLASFFYVDNTPDFRRLIPPHLASWQSGDAAACKAVYTGSIPVLASRLCMDIDDGLRH